MDRMVYQVIVSVVVPTDEGTIHGPRNTVIRLVTETYGASASDVRRSLERLNRMGYIALGHGYIRVN